MSRHPPNVDLGIPTDVAIKLVKYCFAVSDEAQSFLDTLVCHQRLLNRKELRNMNSRISSLDITRKGFSQLPVAHLTHDASSSNESVTIVSPHQWQHCSNKIANGISDGISQIAVYLKVGFQIHAMPCNQWYRQVVTEFAFHWMAITCLNRFTFRAGL